MKDLLKGVNYTKYLLNARPGNEMEVPVGYYNSNLFVSILSELHFFGTKNLFFQCECKNKRWIGIAERTLPSVCSDVIIT